MNKLIEDTKHMFSGKSDFTDNIKGSISNAFGENPDLVEYLERESVKLTSNLEPLK